MKLKSIKSAPWEPLGVLVPLQSHKACPGTVFFALLVDFWHPFGLPFSLVLEPFLERFFHYFPQHSQYPMLLIFASFVEAFLTFFLYFLETPATSDICTPFDEKPCLLKVPGLLFSHIFKTFKQLPF